MAEICGIDPEDLKAAARLYAKAEKAPIFYAMGVTQHSSGTAGVMSIANLALLCGKIGKYGCGVNPLRGQNNVQGACDMGCLPGDYTGYQKVANLEARAKFEKAWGVKLPEQPGLTVTEAVQAIEDGKVRCLYIMGENPLLSDPNLNHTEEMFKKLDFLIVQDIFLTETRNWLMWSLPAACFAKRMAPSPIRNAGYSASGAPCPLQVTHGRLGNRAGGYAQAGLREPGGLAGGDPG